MTVLSYVQEGQTPVRGRTGTKGVSRSAREAQIVDAGFAEFAGGYAGTSVAAIAERAEISRAMVYSYFGSLDAVYLACLRQAGDLLIEHVRGAQHGGEPRTRALNTLAAIFAALEIQPTAWSVVFDRSLPRPSEVHTAAQRYRQELVSFAMTSMLETVSGMDEYDELDLSLAVHTWRDVVSSVITWRLAHPEQTPEEIHGRLQRVMALLAPASP